MMIIGGFFVVKKYYPKFFTGSIDDTQLNRTMKLKTELNSIVDKGFNFDIFSNQNFKNLVPYMDLNNVDINNQGHDEPFKIAKPNK
jgi:hypothetical protein